MGAKWSLILAVVFGLVAAALSWFKLQSIDEPVVIEGKQFVKLASNASLAAGDRITVDMLESVEIPAEFSDLHTIAVPYTDETDIWFSENDVRVSQDISTGAFLLHQHLIDDPDNRLPTFISEKNRAISIPVSQISSVSYFIEPGSRIDVLSTFTVDDPPPENTSGSFSDEVDPEDSRAVLDLLNSNMNKQRTITRTLLQNLQVLAVGKATTRNAYLNTQDGYSSVTLDVTPEEAELLTFMMSQASSGFNLALRNPGNTEVSDIIDVDWDIVKNTK